MDNLINRFLFRELIKQRLTDKDEDVSGLEPERHLPFLSVPFSASFAELEKNFPKGRLRECLYLVKAIEETINEASLRRKMPYEVIQYMRELPILHVSETNALQKFFESYGEVAEILKEKLHKMQRSWGRMDAIMSKESKHLSARFLFNGLLANNEKMGMQRDHLLLQSILIASKKAPVFKTVLKEFTSGHDSRVYVKRLVDQKAKLEPFSPLPSPSAITPTV